MADIFISISFSSEFEKVSRAIGHAAQKLSLSCYRTDQEHWSESIPELIQREIRASRFVVADVTGNNPNVLNEVGMAQALGKPLILLSQEAATESAFNVRSLRILIYDPHHLGDLGQKLTQALTEITSPNENLRAMLVPRSLGRPTRESIFVIAASPLSFRRAVGRSGGYKRLRRTSSDYVGVRGILQAFGLLFGFDTLPDNVDPEDCHDDVIKESMTVYCIASPKANRWTGTLLEEYRRRWVPSLEFRADPASKNLRNVNVSLFSDGFELRPPGWDSTSPGDRYSRDFGVIIRGPNPFDESKMMAIIAGRSSLGTEAASIAFTDLQVVGEIRQRLQGPNIDLEDHTNPFWAVVSMKRAEGDAKEEALKDTLKVHQVDTLHRTGQLPPNPAPAADGWHRR